MAYASTKPTTSALCTTPMCVCNRCRRGSVSGGSSSNKLGTGRPSLWRNSPRSGNMPRRPSAATLPTSLPARMERHTNENSGTSLLMMMIVGSPGTGGAACSTASWLWLFRWSDAITSVLCMGSSSWAHLVLGGGLCHPRPGCSCCAGATVLCTVYCELTWCWCWGGRPVPAPPWL